LEIAHSIQLCGVDTESYLRWPALFIRQSIREYFSTTSFTNSCKINMH